jgi:ribosomal protein S12 methylthiotransferase accessory factor
MTATAIRHRGGTYRAVKPQDTWDRIVTQLPRFGITRVNDITDLDEIGIPTWVACRPDGKTFAVSLGTGLDPMQARVSAAMESIEVWHAENPVRPADFRDSAIGLGLPYDIRALNLADRAPLTGHSVLDWTTGAGVLSGQAIPIPLSSIPLDFTGALPWTRALFRPTSNGVASGNTPVEATLHGMLEIVERDCIAERQATDLAQYRYVDVEQASSAYIHEIVARLRRNGCVITVNDITNRLAVPCYAALVWSADVPIYSGGFGCHVDADIALGRALLEAAQSRLAIVSGARDDVDADVYRPSGRRPDPPAGQFVPPRTGLASDGADLESVVRFCAERIAEVTGCEPVTVDLAHDDIGIAVQKTFAPGLRMPDTDRF